MHLAEFEMAISDSGQLSRETRRLRIALLVESSSGGVGRHVVDLANALLELGHSVDLLYSARRIDERFARGLSELSARGIRTCEVDMRHGLHITDMAAVYLVRRFLRANGPFDILHCHSTKAGLIGRLVTLGMNCIALYTPHGLVTNSPFRRHGYRALAGWLERNLGTLGAGVLCVSNEEKEHALEVGFSANGLFVVLNGIDLLEAQGYSADRTEMRSRFAIADRDICVGFVGRMIPGKGPRTLLDAYALAQGDRAFRAKLVFVGEGPERSHLQTRIDRLGLREHVILAGELNGLQAMSAFDIFVLPSLSEAFPYVLIEALAIGLPVISTKVGGVSELVQEGCNGFVVTKSAPKEMAVALRKLLADSGLRRRMGEASLELSRKFSLDEMARGVVQVYQELLH
jgi:glycosyltransferase involved in cell wall biosynthesis